MGGISDERIVLRSQCSGICNPSTCTRDRSTRLDCIIHKRERRIIQYGATIPCRSLPVRQCQAADDNLIRAIVSRGADVKNSPGAIPVNHEATSSGSECPFSKDIHRLINRQFP